ncbi:unnamed protein product [Polarella glacialis]|uniref:Uncharacterized protein n=1 Tax=Polarella glacialis TaxID=89957 RepID=A0A813KQM9_POLGL|nr:unnamed protein product [Polarella glacialis]|eukprot:CAMPEP_0115096586 /NCGR_PEP_ID=MMETSP0227-20121206/29825_1 /TAXON_ID=89957 /ORGANISM="Polarella glacialis, Strain CCMP 1383" /LENGTH=137 /DNA_ID=CAMNT_0002490375 /DNA_START=64 /DNA_END=477 /DNA_ORIENTATION=-
MAKDPRRRAPGTRKTKAVVKKNQQMRKRNDKRKARSGKKVDDLADRLAGSVSTGASMAANAAAAAPGPGARRPKDDEMKKMPASTANRSELHKKLRARLAIRSLERTSGETKGLGDSRQMNLTKKEKKAKKDAHMGV